MELVGSSWSNLKNRFMWHDPVHRDHSWYQRESLKVALSKSNTMMYLRKSIGARQDRKWLTFDYTRWFSHHYHADYAYKLAGTPDCPAAICLCIQAYMSQHAPVPLKLDTFLFFLGGGRGMLT